MFGTFYCIGTTLANLRTGVFRWGSNPRLTNNVISTAPRRPKQFITNVYQLNESKVLMSFHNAETKLQLITRLQCIWYRPPTTCNINSLQKHITNCISITYFYVFSLKCSIISPLQFLIYFSSENSFNLAIACSNLRISVFRRTTRNTDRTQQR